MKPVSAQLVSSGLNSDTLCFTLEQSKHLLRSTEKYYVADSLTHTYEKKIQNLQKVIQTQSDKLQLGESLINFQSNEITKLQRQKKLLSTLLGSSVVALIVFVIL